MLINQLISTWEPKVIFYSPAHLVISVYFTVGQCQWSSTHNIAFYKILYVELAKSFLAFYLSVRYQRFQYQPLRGRLHHVTCTGWCKSLIRHIYVNREQCNLYRLLYAWPSWPANTTLDNII